jgi:hypothetical protein
MKKLLLLLSFIYVTQVEAQCPITVSGSATICVGGSTTFTVSGATTYTWAPATSLDNANIANPTASPTTTTIYTVTATTGTCITSGTTTVTVNSLPSYTLAGNAFTICNGGQQTFNVSGASSYTWTPVATLDNGNIANPTANPTTTTVYSVTGTDANACTNLTPATVTVNVTPVPSLSVAANSYTICEGSSQMLSASGASTYTWVPAGILSNPNIANPVALPLTTTIYTVYGTASGCAPSAPLTVTVNVNATPTVSVVGGGNSQTLCSFATVSGITFSTNPVGSISWTNSNTAIGLPASGFGNIASFTAPSVSVQTTAVITASTMAFGCSSNSATQATYTIIINPNPQPPVLTAPTGTNNAYCQGSPYSLTVNSGTAIAVWYSNNNVVNLGSSFTPQANLPAGTYTFSIIDSANGGCIDAVQQANTMTLTLVVNPTPPAPILTAPTGANNSFCQGSPTSLTVNSGVVTAVWYSYNTVVNVGSTFTPPSNLPIGTYTYSIIDSIAVPGGCTNASQTANTLTLTLVVNPSPSVTYTLVQDAAPHTWDLYPTVTGGMPAYTYNFSWGDGSPNSTTPNPSHTYSVAGTYSICVTVTDAFGCISNYCQNDAVSRLGNNSTQSNMVYVNVINNAAGISVFNTQNPTFKIYPNPAQNNFTVETNATEKQTLQLFDVNGKLVLSQTINEKATIDAGNFNAGVYSLSIISNEGVLTKKLVIVK